MNDIGFYKCLPGGNPTIILADPEFAPERLAEISAQLMHPLDLSAEQVGALYAPGTCSHVTQRTGYPHLQMMGNEFCVNATRCAAMILARAVKLRVCSPRACSSQKPGNIVAGELTVSGTTSLIRVLVADSHASLIHAVRLEAATNTVGGPAETSFLTKDASCGIDDQASAPKLDSLPLLHCAARIPLNGDGSLFEYIPSDEHGLALVRLPGIDHLLVDTRRHSLPDIHAEKWREESRRWRQRFGLVDTPASGVIWHAPEKEAVRIWPAVAVKETNSEHLETACGSGSLAMALHVYHQTGGARRALMVVQPSEQALHVILEHAPGEETFAASGDDPRPPERPIHGAWVAGQVRLVACGRTYVGGD